MNLEKKKTKSFQLNEETHVAIINYCKRNSLKVNDFASKLLLKTIMELEKNESRSNE